MDLNTPRRIQRCVVFLPSLKYQFYGFIYQKKIIYLPSFSGLANVPAPAVPFLTAFAGPRQSLHTENQSTIGRGFVCIPTATESCSGYINSMLSSSSVSKLVEGFMTRWKFRVKDVGRKRDFYGGQSRFGNGRMLEGGMPAAMSTLYSTESDIFIIRSQNRPLFIHIGIVIWGYF